MRLNMDWLGCTHPHTSILHAHNQARKLELQTWSVLLSVSHGLAFQLLLARKIRICCNQIMLVLFYGVGCLVLE